jgi:hypothetical protein
MGAFWPGTGRFLDESQSSTSRSLLRVLSTQPWGSICSAEARLSQGVQPRLAIFANSDPSIICAVVWWELGTAALLHRERDGEHRHAER